MKIKRFLALIAGLAVLGIASFANACTGIPPIAEERSVIFGCRTEFGVPLGLRLIILTKGLVVNGGSVEGAKPKMVTLSLMWFNSNGHPIKSHEERNEVYDERKPQETELHERI